MNTDINSMLIRIKHIYTKQTFGSRYGGSVWISIVIIFVWLGALSYLKAKNNSASIANDWSAKRCMPWILPIAGYVKTPPSGTSKSEFTKQNFQYCIGEIVTLIIDIALAPIYLAIAALWAAIDVILVILEAFAALLQYIMALIEKLISMIFTLLANIEMDVQDAATVVANIVFGVLEVFHLFAMIGSSINNTIISALHVAIHGMIGIIALTIAVFIVLVAWVALSSFFCLGCWAIAPALVVFLFLIAAIGLSVVTVILFRDIIDDAFRSSNPPPPSVASTGSVPNTPKA